MLPTLHLLNTCREWSLKAKDIGAVTSSLEQLLINHIVLPYRSSILDVEAHAEELSTSLSQDLVSTLAAFRFPLPEEATLIDRRNSTLGRSVWKTEAQLTIRFLSLLFDVSLASCLRNTLQLRRMEDPWLEKLFIQLTECAATFPPGIHTFEAQKYRTTLVRWMLEKAVNCKLQLSIPTIEAIIDQDSGLFNRGADAMVQWGVISLCVQNDANIFIIPAPSANPDHTHSDRKPKRCLASLLTTITESRLETNLDYDYVLSGVVIPLCNAFANARDLTGFIRYWNEQLSIVQKRHKVQKNDADNSRCIWEDEQLLQSVAKLVESALNANQIERILSAATSDLTSSATNILTDNAMSLAGLITLDSIFAGISHEETMAELTEAAQSVFGLLGVLISAPSSQTYKWRIWRIKATITDRWVTMRDWPMYKRKARSAICTASELINRTSLEDASNKKKNLSEELHAFRFMLRFRTMDDSFWDEPLFSSRSLIALAVGNVMDAMEPFCHRISQDYFQTIKLLYSVPGWDELSREVKSIDAFYLGCVADILLSPEVLE